MARPLKDKTKPVELDAATKETMTVEEVAAYETTGETTPAETPKAPAGPKLRFAQHVFGKLKAFFGDGEIPMGLIRREALKASLPVVDGEIKIVSSTQAFLFVPQPTSGPAIRLAQEVLKYEVDSIAAHNQELAGNPVLVNTQKVAGGAAEAIQLSTLRREKVTDYRVYLEPAFKALQELEQLLVNPKFKARIERTLERKDVGDVIKAEIKSQFDTALTLEDPRDQRTALWGVIKTLNSLKIFDPAVVEERRPKSVPTGDSRTAYTDKGFSGRARDRQHPAHPERKRGTGFRDSNKDNFRGPGKNSRLVDTSGEPIGE